MDPYDRAFFRRPDDPVSVRPRERDHDIIAAVDRHGLLDEHQLSQLFCDRPEQINYLQRRLNRLFKAHLLERPAAQEDPRRRHGSGVYGVDYRGADLLPPVPHFPRARSSRAYRIRTIPRSSFDHKFNTSKVSFAIELACRQRRNVRFISRDEIIANASPAIRRQANPWGWPVNVLWRGEWIEIWIYPDTFCGIHYLDTDTKTFLLIENDEGTEPMVRDDLSKTSSFVRKLLGYAHSYVDDRLHQLYRMNSFRVLTVASRKPRLNRGRQRRSSSRVQQLRELYMQHAHRLCAPDVFLFADRKDFYASSDALAFPWITGDGKRSIKLDSA